jgi:hypothetical protein
MSRRASVVTLPVTTLVVQSLSGGPKVLNASQHPYGLTKLSCY